MIVRPRWVESKRLPWPESLPCRSSSYKLARAGAVRFSDPLPQEVRRGTCPEQEQLSQRQIGCWSNTMVVPPTECKVVQCMVKYILGNWEKPSRRLLFFTDEYWSCSHIEFHHHGIKKSLQRQSSPRHSSFWLEDSAGLWVGRVKRFYVPAAWLESKVGTLFL